MTPSHESDKPPPTMYSITIGLLAGGVAGGVSRTAVAPIERLKILMQVQGKDKVYQNMWQGFVHMTRTGGLREWFKGNGTNCLRIVPNSAVKFVTYQELSRMISNQRKQETGDGTLNPAFRMLAGAAAGIVAMSSTYHLDMVRGRLTVQEGFNQQQYRGILHAYSDIISKEGVKALYRGWLPSVIGVVPYVGLNFAVYETLKDMAVKSYGVQSDRDLSSSLRLAAGGVAGTIGQTVAYPFDVVRRRLQVSGWAGAKNLHAGEGGHAVRYKGMVDCFLRTSKEEGVPALFKGIVPNYVKVIPSIAIAFVVYEHVCERLQVEVKISSS